MESSPDEPSIPVVDHADLVTESPGAIDAIATAFGHFGLLYIRGTPLSPDDLDTLYRDFLAVLDRPAEEKATWGGPDIWFQRGWTPPNTEHAIRAGGQPDFKECYFAAPVPLDAAAAADWPELYAPNVWPARAPAFAAQVVALGAALQTVGDTLLRGCARALGQPADAFAIRTAGAPHVTRLLKYLPLRDVDLATHVLWGEEHTDFNLLTLLPGGRFFEGDRPTSPPEDRGGLYLRTRPTAEHPQGRRVAGRPPPGCIVAQVGQQLEVLSNGRFLATPHGIIPPGAPGMTRTSLAHFVHLHPRTVIAPLSGLATDDSPYRPPVLAGTWALRTLVAIGLAPPSILDRLGYQRTWSTTPPG